MNISRPGAGDYTEGMFRRLSPRSGFSNWCAGFFALLFAVLPLSLPAAETADEKSILLVASENMPDPRFRQTVVLVTRHGSRRTTIGVIVNRATDASLDSLFPDLKSAAGHRLHIGGPVAPDQLVFLVRGAAASKEAIDLGEKMYLGSESESLRRLLDGPKPATQLRVFQGFSAWARGQLEHEIARGDWHLLPVDGELLFSEPLENLWPKLWRRATQVMVKNPVAPPQRPDKTALVLACR